MQDVPIANKDANFFEKVSLYIDNNVATDKVLDKWAAKKYAPTSFAAFLNSELMKKINIHDRFEELCALGYILAQREDLNDGQRQKCLSEYLRYIKNN